MEMLTEVVKLEVNASYFCLKAHDTVQCFLRQHSQREAKW